MLKIAICDDNELQIEMLQELLYDYNSVSTRRVDVSAFSSGADVLAAIKDKGRFDIYILDVMMPEMDGMELAKTIRENDEIGRIVFLSSETSFVYKAFSVNASGYLVKPVNPEELFELIDTLRTKIEREQPSFIRIAADEGEMRVEVRDILYVDTVDRAPVYHKTDGTALAGKSRRSRFQEMVSELLDSYNFVLSSVGVAVNLANVESFKKESNEIKLRDGSVLLCSRTMREYFLRRLEDYWNS